MSDISLTASMRTNLLALQNTQSLVGRTQERLSTGLKVNSALDNASSYYTARSLNNRASDLSSLLDSMGQGVQTIKAANEGIESITSFVEQAKAVANSARDTNDETSRAKYMDQFNEILRQIDAMAKDSSYKGINLLAKEDLTVTFNESIKEPSKVEINGVDASSKGLNLHEAKDWTGAEVEATAEEEAAAVLKAVAGKELTLKDFVAAVGNEGDADYEAAKDAVKITVPSDYNKDTYVPSDELIAAYQKHDTAATAQTVKEAIAAAIEKWGEDTANAKDVEAAKAEVLAAKKIEEGNKSLATSLEEVSEAINTLRDYASTFGNFNTIVQTRQEFTKNLINVLTEGADDLTLADMNEESANMLALQTRQQLGVNSLSLAAQAAQSVLSLF